MSWEGSGLWIAKGLGISLVGVVLIRADRSRGRLECAVGDAERTHEAGHKSSARSVTAENYSSVGSFGETEAITAHRDAKPTGRQPYTALAVSPTSPVRHDPSEGGE
jgi:hypothetical protein